MTSNTLAALVSKPFDKSLKHKMLECVHITRSLWSVQIDNTHRPMLPGIEHRERSGLSKTLLLLAVFMMPLLTAVKDS